MQVRFNKIIRTAALAAVALGLSLPAHAATTEQVDAAIKKGVEFLYSKQNNGHWEKTNAPDPKDTQFTGLTALATYALLAAGESPQNPKLAQSIEWLKKNDTKGIYALGCRAQVWNLIPHEKDQSVVEALKKDAALLLEGARKAKGQGFRGLYHYTVSARDYDASCSQYGVLGMWAMDRAGLEIPDLYWQSVEDAWKKNQNPDGGWSYIKGGDAKHGQTTINMTAAGIATLFITQDYLRSMDGIRCTGNTANEPIDKAMTWIETNLPELFKKNQVIPYGMYGIERIGVASGYKYFGSLDWYKEGSDQLVKRGFADVPTTSFIILFLARGRAPVVMNKLQYSIDKKEGNWNQRPRDAANVVRYVAKQMERDLNWQIVNLNVDVDDLHDSPILYISGNQALKFTEEEEGKLKQFVEQGGLILGHADCSEPNFAKSFKALGSKLFKNAGEFRKLEADHPIYTRQQFLAKNWKNKPDIQGLSNQVRELMLLIPSGDPGKAWQLNDNKSKEEQFQMLSDIFLYSVEGKDLRYKGSTYIVKADPKVKASKTLKIARIDAGENSDPEPGGWRRLSNVIHNGFGIDLETPMVKLTPGALKDYKLAHLTGTGKLKLKEDQQKVLKEFVDGGGTLMIDAANGDSEFAAAIEDTLQHMFGDDAGQLSNPIEMKHALYNATGTQMGDIVFRSFARGKVPRGQNTPLLRGITVKGRLAVILSREDLSGGIVGESIDGILGYAPESATQIMTNVVLFANGGAKPLPPPSAKPAAPPAKPAAPAPPKPAASKPAEPVAEKS
jgi:hypothetical protein